MNILFGALGFIAACTGAYIIYITDTHGYGTMWMDDNFPKLLVGMFVAFTIINSFLRPEVFFTSVNRVYETDPNWMLICLISAGEALIIGGIICAICIIKYKKGRK